MKKQLIRLINRKKIYYPLIILFLLFSQSLLFVAGSFQPETRIEETSIYVANIAKNKTKSGTYASLLVESKDGTTKQMRDPSLELYDLYGVFTERVATFSSFVNADHKYRIHFDEFDQEKNLSVIYTRHGFNTGDKKSRDGHFLDQYFHLEVMFESKISGSTLPYWMYISKTQADKLLDTKGLEHSETNYKSLINTKTKMVMGNNEPVDWTIKNIYLEQNYFYEAVYECAGEFIFGSTGYPSEFKMQAMYFMSDYVFRNKFFIEYATSYYPTSEFDYSIGKFNLKDGASIDLSKLVFEADKRESYISVLLTISSVLLLVLSLLVVFLSDFSLSIYNLPIFVLTSLLPFVIFKIIYSVSSSINFFSFYSNRVNMITLIVATVAIFIIFYLRIYYKNKGAKKAHE